jgi:hypothetical protein
MNYPSSGKIGDIACPRTIYFGTVYHACQISEIKLIMQYNMFMMYFGSFSMMLTTFKTYSSTEPLNRSAPNVVFSKTLAQTIWP